MTLVMGAIRRWRPRREAHFVEMEVIPRLYMKAMHIAFFY
jgi:hypothetical protein